ncbi:unnamed protein product, partial [Linum tenue]
DHQSGTKLVIHYNIVDCRECFRLELQRKLSGFLNFFILVRKNFLVPTDIARVYANNYSFHPNKAAEQILHELAATPVAVKPKNLHHFEALTATSSDERRFYSFFKTIPRPAIFHLQSQRVQLRTAIDPSRQTVTVVEIFDCHQLEASELRRFPNRARTDVHDAGASFYSLEM